MRCAEHLHSAAMRALRLPQPALCWPPAPVINKAAPNACWAATLCTPAGERGSEKVEAAVELVGQRGKGLFKGEGKWYTGTITAFDGW